MVGVAVIGSRGFHNYEFFSEKLNYFLQNLSDYKIISGGAVGTDSMARRWAEENRIKIVEYLPEYDKFRPKIAPLKRNHTIVENADIMVAFQMNNSKGTEYTINLAKKKGIPIRIIKI